MGISSVLTYEWVWRLETLAIGIVVCTIFGVVVCTSLMAGQSAPKKDTNCNQELSAPKKDTNYQQELYEKRVAFIRALKRGLDEPTSVIHQVVAAYRVILDGGASANPVSVLQSQKTIPDSWSVP